MSAAICIAPTQSCSRSGPMMFFRIPKRARRPSANGTRTPSEFGVVAGVVTDIRSINPDAEVLLLGGYNPIPEHPLSKGISRYLRRWDKMLNKRLESDPLIDIVKTSDIIDGPQKLSPLDHFHPGAAAYRDVAKRIADMLLEQFKAV